MIAHGKRKKKIENKKQLIYKEDLIAEYDRVHIGPPGGARKLMEDAPTVDPIHAAGGCYCHECKSWHEEIGWCDKHSHFVDRLGDFCYPEESGDWKDFDADYFCKDGERKDNVQ